MLDSGPPDISSIGISHTPQITAVGPAATQARPPADKEKVRSSANLSAGDTQAPARAITAQQQASTDNDRAQSNAALTQLRDQGMRQGQTGIQSYRKGGVVRASGPALLHEGERKGTGERVPKTGVFNVRKGERIIPKRNSNSRR